MNIVKVVTEVVVYIAILFVVLPFLFGWIDNPWIKFILLIIWLVLIVGKLSGLLIDGIQKDVEMVRRGRSITTGKKIDIDE